jgi:hypothetical protein
MIKQIGTLGLGGLLALGAMFAQADTIDPPTFEATLDVGESVTISKTVVVEAAGPSDALVDIMFVFDVTGSMGGEIADARASADGVLSSLAGLYDLTSGSGWYSDNTPGNGVPGISGGEINVNLNAGNTGDASGINDMWDAGSCTVAGVFVGCGGDGPETGYDGIADAARNADWRDGSNRFIVALGDAGFKDSLDNQASTIAALDAENVTLLGLTYSGSFTSSMQGLIDGSANGGIISASGASLVDFVEDAIEASFAEYSTVSVGDLGGGLPGVGVSAVCTGADSGACAGDSAVGDFDRSIDRTFTFDVTFTGLEEGVWDFPTFALVDGGIVARELDTITVGEGEPMPLPGSLALLGLGLTGLAGLRRRRAA